MYRLKTQTEGGVSPLLINNFRLSDAACAALVGAAHPDCREREYLVPRCADKPLHIVRCAGGHLPAAGEVSNMVVGVEMRRVQRGPQAVTVCAGISVNDAQAVARPGVEGLVRLPFLSITLRDPARDREAEGLETPTLFYSRVFHGHAGPRLTGFCDPAAGLEGVRLAVLEGASMGRLLHTATLWTNMVSLKDHPRFVVEPTRMGRIRVEQAGLPPLVIEGSRP